MTIMRHGVAIAIIFLTNAHAAAGQEHSPIKKKSRRASFSRSASTKAAVKPKIVNGDEVTAHSMPWIVSLQSGGADQDRGFPFCGGTLISATEVVTAAHCVVGGVQQVVANMHNKTGDDDGLSQTVPVSKVCLHAS